MEAAPVAEWLRPIILSALNRSSSHRCGFEPRLGSHVRQANFCLRMVRGLFSGISRFRPTLRLARFKMSELILTGRITQIKNKIKGPMATVVSIRVKMTFRGSMTFVMIHSCPVFGAGLAAEKYLLDGAELMHYASAQMILYRKHGTVNTSVADFQYLNRMDIKVKQGTDRVRTLSANTEPQKSRITFRMHLTQN